MNVEEALRQKLGCAHIDLPIRWSGGGLNETSIVSTDRGKFFIKRHAGQSSIDMYIAEYKGLETISATKTIRVPKPYCYEECKEGAFLIMEYVELVPHTSKSQQELGEQLAQMHLFPGPCQFGFMMNNTIGLTPQENPWCSHWVEFFSTHRLNFQLERIEKRYRDAELRRKAEPLLNRFPAFFEGLKIVPALLHGDLWPGNTGCDQSGVLSFMIRLFIMDTMRLNLA